MATSATRSRPTSPADAAALATSDSVDRSVVEITARMAPRSRRWRVRRRVSMPSMATMPFSARNVGQGLLAAPARGLVAHLADHESLREDAARLHVGAVDPVVADMRHRHRDDLPGVAGIGEHLLVARHRRVEAQLPGRLTRRTAREAAKHRAIFKRQQRRGTSCHGARPPFHCARRTFRRQVPPWPYRVV